MATKNLFLFKAKFDSINTWFKSESLYKNMIWLLGFLQLFLCNYVVCLFTMAINFFARFLVEGDKKAERCFEIDGFREEIANFLFRCHEDLFEEFEKIEEKSQFQEDKKEEEETESSVSMEVCSDNHEGETDYSAPMVIQSELREINEKQEEAGRLVDESSSVSMNVQCDIPESEKEGEIERLISMEANSATTTQKYEYVSGRDISGFMEEPTSMRFTFQEFFVGPNIPGIFNNNAEIIAQKQESPEHTKEEEEEGNGESESTKEIEAERVMEAREERSEESGKERSNHEQEVIKQRERKEEWKRMMEELESEVGNEWRMEWEHDDIVEQLKIELRNARQGGLSTIIEEQEDDEEEDEDEDEEDEDEEREGETGETEETGDQKLVQNNEENEEFNDQMDEIEEVYQIYEDKMRKLDILNYQTMHGLGLLQLKESSKSSFKGLKPLISQNLWPKKESKTTPIMKLVQELQRDLEIVYVGQVCLSWEILCWLHKKALQLKQLYSQQTDHHFNVAAGEFQLFQVLLQRFIENEAFQGPRTLNFVKNRCVIRNLLQVPPIRDDSSKEKNLAKGVDEEFVVSIERLAEIIKESMWLFWRFVRADKETRTDPKDPAISDLLKLIRPHLHKKEKKLKDLVRTGNCIVRKFQKQQGEDELNHEQLLAQVELKLVSRVLNLSKLRKEHLIWCNEKLKRIKFVMKKKKVMVDPSFLLFPC